MKQNKHQDPLFCILGVSYENNRREFKELFELIAQWSPQIMIYHSKEAKFYDRITCKQMVHTIFRLKKLSLLVVYLRKHSVFCGLIRINPSSYSHNQSDEKAAGGINEYRDHAEINE